MTSFRVLAAATALVLAAAPLASAQVSYRVICNGGGGMTATATPGGNLQLVFVRGTTAASPAEGACVWLDRSFGEGEPNVMLVTGNVDFARYIANAVIGGDVFYADIYNNGSGAMIVTRIGL